ncbi:hypothetical protein CIL05_04620 [Virgibacillus profundi]|uniref:Uncharacterized protein n=1 Tax=Virgibacillus profundi TaxID=2024555 RepID=A0A2A2IH90_9BACI|nr:hypothetical protein [Virgibacillus profundi]PAV30997.1 hypothetical protein CIL05_04620 [Virgibacillus profundi]PXY55182.1 hypothetical protein CIT14_04705 [Virgibacillus profundi]
MSSKKYYYVTGNTAEGLVNFLPPNVENFNQIIILKHPSHQLKTAVLKNIIKTYEDQYNLEILLSTLGNDFIEGVIIREISVVFIMDRIASGDLGAAIELDMNLFLNEEVPSSNEMIEARKNFDDFTNMAYENFKTGLQVHDELEGIFIAEMDFDSANRITEELIDDLLKQTKKQDRKVHVSHRLFGTNTVDGVVNEVPHIIENLATVIHVKGRAGTGKSTLMKKVSVACQEHGLDVELYHCSFDPNSIDMVLVPDLDFCIFDSTDPHEFFPEKSGEKIIDLYEETVTPGTDEKYADKIYEVNRNYKSYMKKGVQHLKKAGNYLNSLEENYSFSESEINKITTFILDKVVT